MKATICQNTFLRIPAKYSISYFIVRNYLPDSIQLYFIKGQKNIMGNNQNVKIKLFTSYAAKNADLPETVPVN